jgi:hypothetical protein
MQCIEGRLAAAQRGRQGIAGYDDSAKAFSTGRRNIVCLSLTLIMWKNAWHLVIIHSLNICDFRIIDADSHYGRGTL